MVENSAVAASCCRVSLLGTQMNGHEVGRNSLQLLAFHFCYVELVPKCMGDYVPGYSSF